MFKSLTQTWMKVMLFFSACSVLVNGADHAWVNVTISLAAGVVCLVVILWPDSDSAPSRYPWAHEMAPGRRAHAVKKGA